MSEIQTLLTKLKGTREEEILLDMEKYYEEIKERQKIWYEKTELLCPEGCGECCRNFEPDLLEGEALYMAAWLLENQPETAEKIQNGEFPFSREKGCQFWNEKEEYHCSIYGGRPFICRFFGACGSHGKTGETVFKPCKFYPVNTYKKNLEHRQYSQKEIENIFGILPVVMNDVMERVVSINPEVMETKLIREILPDMLRKIKWICSLSGKE